MRCRGRQRQGWMSQGSEESCGKPSIDWRPTQATAPPEWATWPRPRSEVLRTDVSAQDRLKIRGRTPISAGHATEVSAAKDRSEAGFFRQPALRGIRARDIRSSSEAMNSALPKGRPV